MPHYSLPIDIEDFLRLYHESYDLVVANFIDEKSLRDRIERRILDTLNEVLDNHVSKIVRKHLNY